MQLHRIYHAPLPRVGEQLELPPDTAHYASRVLRLGVGDTLELFSGNNDPHIAEIIAVTKKTVTVTLLSKQEVNKESPLAIHLIQGISKGDRMDFVLQKSVELGVHSITPLFTQFCNVKLSGERLEKRIEQWQKMVISACEQSGRNTVPLIRPALTFDAWLQQEPQGHRIFLDPEATDTFNNLPQHSAYELVIGPEGGFSPQEIAISQQQNIQGVALGPRILRTETAALAAITALQCYYGDLSSY